MENNNKAKMIMKREWSENQEHFLKVIAERSQSREIMHLNAHRQLKKQCAYFKIPTIFISLICGAAQASQSSIESLINNESFDPWIPMILGLLSLFVSMLNSVSSYLQVESRCQQNLSSSVSFGKLSRTICKEVGMHPSERSLNGRDALIQYNREFDQLLESAPTLSRTIERKFSKRSDTIKLNISVPPSIRMNAIKTYTEKERDLELQRQKEMNNLTKKKKALIPSLARSVSSVAVGSKKRRGATLTPTRRLNNPTTERTRVRPMKKKTKETTIELQTLQNQMGGRARQMSMMMERGDFVPENNIHSSDESSSDGSNDERTTTTGGLGFNSSPPSTNTGNSANLGEAGPGAENNTQTSHGTFDQEK